MKLRLLLFTFLFSALSWGQLTESFELGLPTSYSATTTFTLGSGTWSGQANGVIRGTAGVKSGTYSCQLRSQEGAQITSPNITSTVGTVSFYSSSSTASGSVQVNYSIDGGITWNSATGSPFTLTNGLPVLKIATINSSSPNILVQFYRTASTVYIDDVNILAFSTPTYNVTYNGNTNTSGSVPTDATVYNSGDTATVLGNTGSLVKTGFAFNGWNTASDGSGTAYVAGNTFAIAANTTLYAQWLNTSPPVITSSLTASGNQGAAFTYTIVATNTPTSYNATGLPAGLTINTTTGVISGTPTVTGVFNITITATNGIGSDSQTLVLTLGTGPCLSEDFSSATSGNSNTNNGQSTALSGNVNFPISDRAYEAGGAIKLGTSSLAGSITSTSLASVSGNVTVVISVKGWTTVEGSIIITLNGNSQTVPYTAVMADSFEDISASFTAVPAGSILKIETTAKRAFIDKVEAFCTVIAGPEINVSGNAITILDNDTNPSTADGTSFGSTVIGTPIIKTFTIHNQGTTDLVLSGPVTLTDVSAPQEFVISQPAITTIPAGGSTTFTITFNSAVAGLFTNTVNINSNDTDEALYNFDIMASAYAPSATGTVFRPGDLIFVGYDSTVSAAVDCSGGAQMDKLYVANLVDILPGTEFMVVNSRYESGAAANVRTDRWYSGSTDPYDDPGIITFKWNGVAPIVAGSIITFKANVFTVSDIRINDVVTTDFGVTTNANQCNISSSQSDQIYIMQGTFTSFGTIGTNRYNLFNGNVLFGLTNGANWVPFTSGVSAANSSAGRVSRLPEDLECFNIESSSLEGVRFYRNNGLHTGSKNQILGAIMNLGNWSAPSNDNCLSTTENFSPSANDNAVGKPFTITPSNPDGTWTGFTDTDWFKCSNWEGLAVPKPITDVIIPNVVNQPIIGASPAKFPTGAFSNNLTVNNGSSLTMNTAASRLNLYGNWTNDAGNDAFQEGNGTVHFDGTVPQIINNVTPAGTEVFYNVVMNNNFDTAVSNDLIAAGNLIINAGRTLNIDGNGYVRVNNKLTHNGDLIIQNNGQFIQVNETDSNDGVYSGTKFQVIRTASVRNLDYVYWGSPVENFAVSNLPNSHRYYWNTLAANANGTQGNWAAATGNMTKGQGYIARASNGATSNQAMNLVFSGKPNNGIITLPIVRGTYDGADYDAEPSNPNNIFTTKYDDNWSLVGNPYPSAIDAEEFLVANQTKIEGAVWIWTHGTLPSSLTDPFYDNYVYNYTANDFIKYNGLGATEPDTFAGKIASGQGFMVNMLHTTSTPNTIEFNNSLRTGAAFANYDNTDFYRTATSSNSFEDQEKHRMWLDVVNTTNGQSDRTLLGYATNATNARDHFYDCFHKPNNAVSFYSLIDGAPFIIQGRSLPFDVNDKVPMGFSVGTTSAVTIAIRKVDGVFSEGQTIYLEDKALSTIHNLSANPYSFTSNAGIFTDRFVIRYTNETLSNPDFIEDVNAVFISSKEGITVTSKIENIQEIEVYDLLGRKLYQNKNIDSQTHLIQSIQKNNSGLILTITLENGKKVIKKTIY